MKTFLQILSTALSTLASSSLSVFLPTLATQYTTPLNSNLLLSLMNIFAIAGQVISGALQDSPAPSSKSWKLLRTKGSPYYFIVGVSSLMSSVGVLGGLAFVHNVKELVGVVIWLGLAVSLTFTSFASSLAADLETRIGRCIRCYMDTDFDSSQ